jgi:cyclic pyranopterin phosphate synthase
MSSAEVLNWLQRARRQGAQHLWLSGGEPTLRRDFLPTLRAAKSLGYRRIKVQSNGMLFAYPEFADKAVSAGMNEVNLLLKSLQPRVHDGLNRTPGSLELMHAGLERLRALPVRLEGDVLVTTRNWPELPALVRHYAGLGLKHFNLWLFSLVDQGDADLARLVPRVSDFVPALLEAREAAHAAGATLASLNTPACLLPPEAWDTVFDAVGMGLVVVNPGGKAFPLETSTIEQGVHMAVCADCALRPRCAGIRSDYLAVHGDAEFHAVPAELADRLQGRGTNLDLP